MQVAYEQVRIEARCIKAGVSSGERIVTNMPCQNEGHPLRIYYTGPTCCNEVREARIMRR